MSIIALLNPFEAIVSGETMVVQFPSDYGTYRIDGKEFPSLYNKQLVMSRESTIEKVKKHPKTLVKVVRTDGVEYSQEEFNSIMNKYVDEDGERYYPSLEEEFEHRKLLESFKDCERVYEQSSDEVTTIEVTVVGEYTDTGSKFIETPLVYGKGRWFTGSNSFYRVNVSGVIGDTIKKFADDNEYKFENSTHSGFRYAKVDGKYVIPKEFELLSDAGLKVFPTLDQASQCEAETRSKMLNHLRGTFNKSEVGVVTVKQIYSELNSLQNSLDNLEVKQKSFNSLNSLRGKVRALKETLGNLV